MWLIWTWHLLQWKASKYTLLFETRFIRNYHTFGQFSSLNSLVAFFYSKLCLIFPEKYLVDHFKVLGNCHLPTTAANSGSSTGTGLAFNILGALKPTSSASLYKSFHQRAPDMHSPAIRRMVTVLLLLPLTFRACPPPPPVFKQIKPWYCTICTYFSTAYREENVLLQKQNHVKESGSLWSLIIRIICTVKHANKLFTTL